MTKATTIYFDDSEVSVKESLYASCDAVKHRPADPGAFTFESKLPNGKQLTVECNDSCTQIRITTKI